MRKENASKIAGQLKEIKDSFPRFRITAGRVSDVEQRLKTLKQALKEEGDNIVTMNLLSTVIEVPTSAAIKLLEAAYEQELLMNELYEWRLDKALSYITGEYDVDFYNNR